MKKNNLRKISLPRITFFAGLFLLLLTGAPLAGILISGAARGGEKENVFYRLIREYDFKYRQIPEMDSDMARRQSHERLDSDLDRLEKVAEGVENWLSVLKRRRQLAQLNFRYETAYRQSAQKAAQVFPFSEPIAAIAAAALVRNAAITPEGEEYLRKVLPLLGGGHRYAPLRLSLHALLGDFKTPERAEVLYRDFAALEYITNALSFETEAVFADLVILKILAGDIPSAAIDLQFALNSAAFNTRPSPGFIRLAAEYFYDFGDLLRSAELFSMLPGEADLSRQADALWLAGYTDNARTLWAMQTAPGALYNLALTAPTWEEEAALLDRLVSQDSGDDPIYRFGLIRFSRLLDAPRALSLLDAKSPADFLIELEIIKRRTEVAELARVFAEIWLLLERYPEAAELYQWGLWYFNLQRNYIDSAKLLEIAARRNFTGYWMDLYTALQQIRGGNMDAAEEMLAAAFLESGDWAAAANLGRVLETRHAPVRALEHYESAMAEFTELVFDPEDDRRIIASRIQVRIALCLKSMGKVDESRRVLDYALDLNPDNLNARLELSRLD